MHHFKGDPCCPSCCPIPTVTVGSTITTPPGTRARVTASPTPCGVELEFAIPRGKPGPEGPAGPQGEQGPAGPDLYASFVAYMQQFANGSPISFTQAVADPTGHISQPSATQVALAPGTYFVTYHVSAVLEAAGYLQITPFYNGAAFLEYGVYDRVSSASVSVSGSAAFIAVVPAQTVLTLNCNSSAAVRDGAMTMVIMGLHTEESGA